MSDNPSTESKSATSVITGKSSTAYRRRIKNNVSRSSDTSNSFRTNKLNKIRETVDSEEENSKAESSQEEEEKLQKRRRK
jgi:hypothetical protein